MNDFKYWNYKFQKQNIINKDKSITAYIDYMLNRTQAIFEYDNLPASIPKRELELNLQTLGYVAVIEHEGKLYALNSTLGGKPDAYYRPTKCIVANPGLNLSKTYDVVRKADDDNIDEKDVAVIISNDSLKCGLLPLFGKYSVLLAEGDISLRMASINMRQLALISASDDRTKNGALQYLKDIEEGKLGIAMESAFMDGIKVNPIASSTSSYLVQLIEYNQFLKSSWYKDLGIVENDNKKRENLNTNETDIQKPSLLPLIDDMLNCRKEALEAINKKYNLNIQVRLSSQWKVVHEEVCNHENEDNVENTEMKGSEESENTD